MVLIVAMKEDAIVCAKQLPLQMAHAIKLFIMDTDCTGFMKLKISKVSLIFHVFIDESKNVLSCTSILKSILLF